MTITAFIAITTITIVGAFCIYWSYYKGHKEGLKEGLRIGRRDCENQWDGWSRFKEVVVQEKLKELMQELGLENYDFVDESFGRHAPKRTDEAEDSNKEV